MGPQEDYIETVVTCEGDFHDPQLQDRLQRFQQRLENLLLEDGKNQLVLKKVEPWNSVRVTFHIPREAALRLKQLAEQGSAILRQMGVLGVQIEGDRLVSLTVATPNNQRAELIIRTNDVAAQAAAAGAPQSASAGASVSFDPGMPSSSDEPGSPGPSMEVTRKNIEEYLRQGSLFGTITSSGAGHGADLFKAPSAEGGPFRVNNIVSDAMPGPSGLSGFPSRSAFHGPGAFAPQGISGGPQAPGHRAPRPVGSHTTAQLAQQQLQQQQMSGQGTALPQTAAVGYNMLGLPPPPPYPHGHQGGVPNNVGRQGKKATASSPLLINLLQTDPSLAAANSAMAAPGTEKPKKKRRRKNKQAAATVTSEEQVGGQDMHSLPSNLNPVGGGVPPQTMPSAEEMSAVLHRQVSPVPLPSPRLSAGFGPPLPTSAEHTVGSEAFRDRKPPTASAALASLAHSQMLSSSNSDNFNADSIINPYTGHLEPRDSASDLSPVKKDQHKGRSQSLPVSPATSLPHPHPHPHPPPPVSVSAANFEARTGSSDSLHVGLGSFHPGAAVPTTLREESRGQGFPFPSSVSQAASSQSDSVSANPRLSTVPSTSSLSAAPHIYAQYPRPLDPSQLPSRTAHSTPPQQHSLPFPMAAANGPLPITTTPSSQTVSASEALVPQHSGLESRGPNPYCKPPFPHRPPPSLHADVAHNVPVSSEARIRGTSEIIGHPSRTVTSSQQVMDRSVSEADVQQGAPPPSTASAQAQSDSLKLLNSSSSSTQATGVVQRVIAAETATSTASPTGSKPPSDGDDNSNHSNVSPGGQADSATAPSSMLDANGTKVDNHDSGVGSSSERSEDTTPSEAGDGEFQASVTSVEVSAADSNGSKVAVSVSKAVVNCKKEAGGGGGDPHTITVGYVQMNQHAADLYKDSKKNITDPTAPVIGDKASAEDSLQQVSQLIKSTASLTPVADQMALAAHKDIDVSLSMSAKISSAQQQRLNMMKYKAAQVAGVHQNGPHTPPPQGVRHQHLSGLRLPNNTHSSVHHPTGITISHSQAHLGMHPHHPPPSVPPTSQSGQRLPPTQGPDLPPGGVAVSQAVQNMPGRFSASQSVYHAQGGPALSQSGPHVPGSVSGSQPASGQTVQSRSVPTSQTSQNIPGSVSVSRTLQTPPVSTSLQSTGSVTTSLAVHQVARSVASSESVSHAPVSVADSQVTVSGSQTMQQTARSVASSQGPVSTHHTLSSVSASLGSGRLPLHHSAAPSPSVAPSQSAVTHSAGVTSFPGVGTSVFDSRPQPTAGGLVAHSGAVMAHSQGLGPAVTSTMQHVGLPSLPAQQTHPPSPNQHPQPHPANGPSSLPNAISGRQVKVPRTVPSPLLSAAATTVDSMGIARSVMSTAHNDRGSVVSSHKGLVENSIPSPVSKEGMYKGHTAHLTASSPLGTNEGDAVSHPAKSGSPRLAHSMVNIGLGRSSDHDLHSMASDLVNSGAMNDLDLLEATFPHSEDVFDEDLALVTEPGLSGFLDGGMRHGATNGSGGISAEARVGSNITSMYTKRSSPINVNMLNHMYAAGLPQPRRLTESVQRLVKPLPNPENSLPAGRTCKSPGASSSRHSSNGSTSPGRAGQGGTRSPGANVSSAAVTRNLAFDKLSSGASSSAVNSVGPGFPPAYHTAQPTVGGGLVNCVNTSVISAAPHPLASLQSGGGRVNQQNYVPSSSSGGSSSFPSSSSSSSTAVPTLLTVTTPQPVSDSTAVASHHQENVNFSHESSHRHVQPSAQNHSTGSSPFPASIPHTSISHPPAMHHPPMPALVQVESSQSIVAPVPVPSVSRVSGSGVQTTVCMPGLASAVSVASSQPPTSVRLSHPTLPLQLQQSKVPVCNTSVRVDSLPSSQPHLSSTIVSSSGTVPVAPMVSTPAVTHRQSVGTPVCVSSAASQSVASMSPFDLSKPVAVGPASQAHWGGAVHVASVSAADTVSRTTVTQKPVAAAPVTAHEQRLLTVSHSSSSNMKRDPGVETSIVKSESAVRTVETRTEMDRPVLSSLPQPSLVSSISDSTVNMMKSKVSTPVSQTVVSKEGAKEAVASSVSDYSRNLTAAVRSVPKTEGGVQSWSQPPELKESEGREETGRHRAASSSMPSLSHQGSQDSNNGGSNGDSLHSKPPLLQPTPPLSLPTPLSSATPPPPPLTPVLPHAPHPGHSTPPLSSTDGQAEMVPSFHLSNVPRTASPLSLDPEPVSSARSVASAGQESADAKRKGKSEAAADTEETPVKPSLGSGEQDNPKANTETASDESSLKTRRFTRKRKSTHSESDSSSEPAPKLSCVDGPLGNGSRGAENKASSVSDQPPKLHREGKRSSAGEKKNEEEKGGKKEEEKSGKKGEEKQLKEEKGGKRDETKGGKKEEERGEKKEDRKEEDKGGKKEPRDDGKNANDKNILEATPEEVARRMAAATTGGKRRIHYAYVPEKSLNQSYFDTPVLTGRTRSQGTRGGKEGSTGRDSGGTAASSTPTASSQSAATPAAAAAKEDSNDGSAPPSGSKRSTRSLRTKDAGESGQSKRKRVKEHR